MRTDSRGKSGPVTPTKQRMGGVRGSQSRQSANQARDQPNCASAFTAAPGTKKEKNHIPDTFSHQNAICICWPALKQSTTY